MRNEDFMHMVRQQAEAHSDGFKEALKWMREPEDIEDHKNDLKLSVKHPYWQPQIDDRALRIMEGQLEVLKAMYEKGATAVPEMSE